MILSIAQARMSSTRLPGKILKEITGKTILEHVYDALPEPRVIALAGEPETVHLWQWLADRKIQWVYGDVDDVLDRFFRTYETFSITMNINPDWILRVCCDCPMLTKEIVANFIEEAWLSILDNGDKFTIYTNRPYDPDGFDLELFSVEALKMAHEHATEPYDREHVTAWMYRHLNVRRFSVFGRPVGPENPEEKVSIDVMADYEKVKKLMEGK